MKFKDNRYDIDKYFYVIKNISYFDSLTDSAEISKTDYIDWNTKFYVLVIEYTPTVTDSVYKYVRYIMDKSIRFDDSVDCIAFVEKAGDYAYVFKVSDECLDRTKCYRLEYIEKPEFQ